MIEMLAVISGETLINAVIWIVVAGIIFGLLMWLIDYCQLPQPFAKVAKIVLVVAAVLILINVLLSLVGHPIWTFK